MILSWLLTLPLAAAQSIPAEPMDPTEHTVLYSPGEELLHRINAMRIKEHLPILWKSDQHICAASLQTAHLAKTDTCSHEGPVSFPTISARLDLCGYQTKYGSEVVACGFNTPFQALEAWLLNPDHAKIIRSPLVTEFGAAYNNGKYVVVFSF